MLSICFSSNIAIGNMHDHQPCASLQKRASAYVSNVVIITYCVWGPHQSTLARALHQASTAIVSVYCVGSNLTNCSLSLGAMYALRKNALQPLL